MSGIFDLLRDAIQPAAAARVGYLQGQTQETDKQRMEKLQDNALKRQSILDQIKASMDKSTVERNNAQANRYDRMNRPENAPAPRTVTTDKGVLQWNPVTGQYEPTGYNAPPRADASPHTINTDAGIMQWDPATHSYRPTGYNPPARAPRTPRSNTGERAQDRLDAKTALDEAIQAVPRPSKLPAHVLGKDDKGRQTMIDNPNVAKATSDSLDYERTTLGPLRKHLMDVTIGDKVPLGGTASTAPSTPATPKYSMSGDKSKAMQDEFDAASSDLNAVLQSAAPDEVKKQARALYDRQQATIAKKYGASAAPDDDDEDM